MKITQEITKALEKAIESYGNKAQFAKALGIAHSTLLFWLSGKTTEINGRLWATKLRPILMDYMDPSMVPELHMENCRAAYIAELQVQNHKTKLLSFEDLAMLDIALMPIREFLQQFPAANSTVFAKETDATSFAVEIHPDRKFFPGALQFLIAGNKHPKSGDIVLAKVRDPDTLILGLYNRNGSDISIAQIFSAKPKELLWNMKTQPGFLSWIFPAVEMNSQLENNEKPQEPEKR